MKKSAKDKQQDILLKLIKPFIYLWMRFDAKRRINKDESIDFKRKEPYVMLANHTFMFDIIHVPLRFKKTPFIIASETLLTKQPLKFLLTQVAHVIPKSKGKGDLKTVRKIFEVIKKGYPILIFPEGDTTFYGETNYIEPATMKLIKKMGLDVITCNVKGGYLSKPRWATGKRKNHSIELNYHLSIKKEVIKTLSVDEISNIIEKDLYNNDYAYQKEKMIAHPGKELASGIEDIVYICPNCEEINTIESNHNEISCSHCKTVGHVDKFGFIQGFKFDNLIDWDNFQRKFKEKLRNSVIESSGVLSFMDIKTQQQHIVGDVDIVYQDNKLLISGVHEETISIDDIENPTITLRRDFGFELNKKHYIIKMNKFGTSFLRVVQDKY